MSFYSSEEMKSVLEDCPQFRDKLYGRGFLLTTRRVYNLQNYPFYGNWTEQIINIGENSCFIYTHHDENSFIFQDGTNTYFLIGHAYDPFRMLTDEQEILSALSQSLSESEDAYWDRESNLTGVFCTGYIQSNQIVYATDCAGMQLVNHGVVDGNLYLTSHSKTVLVGTVLLGICLGWG